MRLAGFVRVTTMALLLAGSSFQSVGAGLDSASVSALLGGASLPSLPQPTIATGAPGDDASQSPTVIPVQPEEHSSIEAAFNRRLKTSGLIKSAGNGGASSGGGANATANEDLSAGNAPQSSQLKQFGYSVFSNPSSKFSPLTDIPIPPEYVLGPGDELRVQYYGSRSDSLSLTVDRNGMVNVPDIGEIGLSGLSYNIARATLAEQISKKLTGVTASITMGHLRSIRVFVLGDVRNPGTYLVSSLSTLSHVLFASGGPSKNGSLRHIQLKRGGKRIAEIDMYDFLLKGDGKNDKPLMPGDVVFVPPIGDLVAVAGEVTRPGIYEMKQERGVKEIIDLAGRPLHTADKMRVELDRLKPNGEREMVDFDLDKVGKGESLHPGDLVVFYPLLEDLSDYVDLSGSVKRPGRYGFKAGMKLTDLVRSLDDLMPQSYLRRVEITHHTVKDGESRVTSRDEVNLQNALAGDAAANIPLKPYDEVLVRSIADWGEAVQVRVGGEVRFPGTYSVAKGERLSSVIVRAGGFTDVAYFPGVMFTRESIRQQQTEENKRLLKQMQGEVASMEAEVMDMRDKDLMAAKQRTLAEAKKIMSELAAVTPTGRLIVDLPEDGRVEGSNADVELRNGDAIFIPERPSEVLVMGQVYNPVALTFDPKLKRDDYIDMSGGVTRLAKEDDVYVVHASGIVAAGRKLRGSPIKPGDTIIVPEDLDHINLMDGTLTWTKALMQIGVSMATLKTIKVF